MYGYETVVPCTLLPSAYDVADESLNQQGVIELLLLEITYKKQKSIE